MDRLKGILKQLRALFRKEDVERELDEEVRFHVEMETERLVREEGLSAVEARRRARLAFGSVERYKDEVRDARWTRRIDDAVRDLRFAFRRLVREPGFSVPTVATLALGVGVSTAVFTLVNAVLLRPLPYPDADRLIDVRHVAPQADLTVTGLSPGIFLHYREQNRAFEDIGVYLDDVRTLTDLGAPEQIRVALVSPSLFSVLRTAPHRGRLPTAAESGSGRRSGVFISHDLWVRRYSADPDIVGRTIEIDRRQVAVVGVAQPGFHFPQPETQLWMAGPMADLLARFGGRASVRSLYLSGVARLSPGVSREDAGRDLDRLVRTLPDAYPDVTAEQLERMELHAAVTPLKDTIVGDVRAMLLLLLAGAGFLLLITWANATNLSLVRAERQRREVAVERALGATDGRLACRFLSESVLITALGGVLGLALAHAAVEIRFGFGPEQLPRLREVALDGAGLGLALSLSFMTAVLLAGASLLSTIRTAHAGPLTGGIGRMTVGRREQTRRRVLVAGQVALALTLLIGSALMARSYWQLEQVELGFEPEGALTFFLPLPSTEYMGYHASARAHDEMLDRLRALPGVAAAEAATVAAFPLTPVPDYYSGRVAEADRPAADSAAAPYALFGFATSGYFRAMGIPLLEGRAFRAVDAAREERIVILSAALARALFGAEDPIGRRVQLTATGEASYTVIGVVGDVPSRTIREGASRALYFPNLYPVESESLTGVVPHEEQYIVRTSVLPTALVPAIRQSIHEVDPKLAMTRIGTLEALVDDSTARARLTMILLAVGAATALILGVIGIYGVLSYTVRRRTSELGIRIALGARPGAVVRMVLRQGALLTLGGIAAGLIAASALTGLLGSLLYEVSPGDPVTFVVMAALLFAVALIASYAPARRAGRIDPVRALKAE